MVTSCKTSTDLRGGESFSILKARPLYCEECSIS